MKVVLIDGQGGRLGQAIAKEIRGQNMAVELLAIGTNAVATEAMLKGGADKGATGENPVLVACRDADVIIGPVGILSADAMLGEITPAMAVAVGQSRAAKILLPAGKCNLEVAGTRSMPLADLVKEAAERLKALL